VSTYIDPGTAITIARQARADEIRQAEQHHQVRIARGHDASGEGATRRRGRRIVWRGAAIAH
jgi:hypothetical protein